MAVLLKIRFGLIAKNDLIAHSKLLRWIAYDSDFIPNRTDKRFKTWERGPTIHWELLKNKEIKSFQEVK